jgi:hypothetical protein
MGSSIRFDQVFTAARTTSRSSSASGSGCGCAECGGLKCLCRPRFFAGQLLTEEEFNRLDRYILDKNRLHNRYLHGWGVVCGLDVVCDDCNGGVVVKEGYALSPCGDDIVVCNDTPVDICSLINACKKKEEPDCGSPATNAGCNDEEQQWVLAICYSESTSRGITPLRNGGSSSGGCGCGCGGKGTSAAKSGCGCGGMSASSAKSGCGCGGGSSHSHGKSSATQSCSSPLQCEPTVVCEGYSFRVYPAPKAGRNDEKTSGAMVDRFMACYYELVDAMPDMPQETSPQVLHEWCCDVKQALLDYLATHPGYDCELRRAVSLIVCPPVTMELNAFMQAFDGVRQRLIAILGEIMFACFCRAFQPPCPSPVMDDCVPLAIVTVNKSNGCKVVNVCNWTTLRKYAITIPNLQYWLSILPVGRAIREALERFCCSGGGLRDFWRGTQKGDPIDPTTGQPINPNVTADPATPVFVPNREANAAPSTAAGSTAYAYTNATASSGQRASLEDISPASWFRPSAQTVARNRTLSELTVEALGNRQESVNAQRLLLGMLGAKGANGEEYLSQIQRDNLAQFFVLDQMAKPMLRTLMPSGDKGASAMDVGVLMNMVAGVSAASEATSRAGTPPDDWRAELNELRAIVKRQQATIDELIGAKSSSTAKARTAAADTASAKAKAGEADTKSASTKSADSKASGEKSPSKSNVKRRPGSSNS